VAAGSGGMGDDSAHAPVSVSYVFRCDEDVELYTKKSRIFTTRINIADFRYRGSRRLRRD